MSNLLKITDSADTSAVETATAVVPVAETASAKMPNLPPPFVLAHAKTAKNIPPQATPSQIAQFRRILVHRWDMIAVIVLMIACGVYGVYAITQLTGFEQVSSQAPLRPTVSNTKRN